MIYRFLQYIFHIFLKIFKAILLPVFPKTCVFRPSCSVYALEAYKKYGLITGSILVLRRILRCHPFKDWTFDPLTDKYKKFFF